MKRLAVVFGILSLTVFAMLIEKNKKKKKKSKKEKKFLEVEMSAPNGEPILSGAGGGKYYMNGGKKVYLRKAK
ncbi:MAG: hypothetical protein M3015_06290 [Bacteroidota bacterium]|nr:hypothetical protein [Bacteroidota bacterium]